MISDDEILKQEAKFARIGRRLLQQHWKFFLVQGIVLALLGVAAVLLPGIASLTTDVAIGWILFITGVYGLGSALGARQAPGFWGNLLMSAVAAVLGALLALWPLQGVLTLTMALAAYFAAQGIGLLIMAFSVKSETSQWLWLLLGAIIDFALAGLIVSGLPGNAGWVLGLLLGINLIFSGLGLIFAALDAKAGI